jgi:hypothetical protein
MAPWQNGRFAAEIDGDFVVFLIGMRINRLLLLNKWLPVAAAMPRMLRELEQHKELGLLSAHGFFAGRTLMTLQYWRSFEQLHAYAHARDKAHLPAWAAFNRAVGNNGAVGVFHETYLVKAGQYESIFVNMPPIGLGIAGHLSQAIGPRTSAKTRLQQQDDGPPAP